MTCNKCGKAYYVVRNSANPADFREKICLCHHDLKAGWQCGHCGELWYISDEACNCGHSERGETVYFCDSKVATLRSWIMNWWYD